MREITKLHEEIVLGNLEELVEKFSQTVVKGEIVLVFDRTVIQSPKSKVQSPKSIVERVAELEKEGTERKLALKKAAKEFGLARSEAYRILQSEKKG